MGMLRRAICAVYLIFVPASVLSASDKLTIGIVLPFTGDYAAFAADMQHGMHAYLSEHGDAVSAIFEDGGTLDPARCVGVAQKLIDQDKSELLLVLSADDALPVVPIINQRKVPLVIAWDSHSEILKSSPLVFSSGFDTQSAGRLLAEFAVQQKRTRVALVSDPSPYTELTRASFMKAIAATADSAIVLDERTAAFDTDLRAFIPKLSANNVDVIYVNLATLGGISNFLRRLKEQGFKGMVLSNELVAGEIINGSASIPFTENLYVSWVGSPNLNHVKAYFKARGRKPQIDYAVAAVGYDAIEAIMRARKSGGSGLISGLHSVFGEDRTLGRDFAIKAAAQLRETAVKADS